jgi:D-alanyl-D-alanine carboxypeptidase
MFQKVSRGAILAVVFLCHAAIAQAQQFAALVMDARTGQVLKAINADTRVYPASLTKMMTLYIVFDQIQRGRLSLDQEITVSANAADEAPSRLGLRAGQKIELRYLIRAAAIKSANDAATAMGDYIGGSEPGFAAIMNQYARAMGMTNTTFKNANGLPRDGHMTTARDMATLGRRLVYDFPQYYNIFGRTSTSAGLATVKNTNRKLLEAYQGADGIKTGYTRQAGFNVVSSAQRGNRRVIVALLGGKSTAARNAQSADLMDYGFAQMPAFARVLPPAALTTMVASVGPAGFDRVAGVKMAVVQPSAPPAAEAAPSLALDAAGRPMPRAIDEEAISRNSATIAAAIAEVNTELKAAQATRNEPAALLDGRPMPRPAVRTAAVESDAGPMAVTSGAGAGSASTFAVSAARPRPAAPAEDVAEPVALTDPGKAAGGGTTGGNDWGVQLGAFRAKGDAERQLLTTALKDVPELDGGLRRVEAASTQGVTVYRAQFVGLSQREALAACASLARMQADCLPLAPGI